MFWKLTTVKILVYTVKASCVIVAFRLKFAKVIIQMIVFFFPVAGLQQLMVTHVSKTLNAWILFWKTWMATENCYYKILLKPKLKFICYFFSKDTYNLSKFILNILNFLKLNHCCILHDCLLFNFLPSITFPPVFSCKYVLSRIRNMFPIQKEQAIIRIFV